MSSVVPNCCMVFVPGISKRHGVFAFRVKDCFILAVQDCLTLKMKGTTIFQNARNYLPSDTASYTVRFVIFSNTAVGTQYLLPWHCLPFVHVVF